MTNHLLLAVVLSLLLYVYLSEYTSMNKSQRVQYSVMALLASGVLIHFSKRKSKSDILTDPF